MINSLNAEQLQALKILRGSDNVFLTGAAGSGKSFLLRAFLKEQPIPVLASTGAAAILVGGRTFHSFFGLGIMEGGVTATVQRALANKRLKRRLIKAKAVIIDEVSMISGATLRAAEMIARGCRGRDAPWGGMRIIAVGDFSQLPPVNPFNQVKDWAFHNSVWAESGFQPVVLNEIMRTSDRQFLEVLDKVRRGVVDTQVSAFLNSRVQDSIGEDFTRLFPHKANVESYNLNKLKEIDHPAIEFKTEYAGNPADIENFKKHSPIPDTISLKVNALVMLRQNDVEGRWVNGSLGRIEEITDESLTIHLESGKTVEVGPSVFTLLNADGSPVVTAENFPVTLAWAMTIHKSQGTTLDTMLVDLRKIWEPGQAYVALSRARDPNGLYIEGWRPESIFADPQVEAFQMSLIQNSVTAENGSLLFNDR